jgi:hypothetical protein
LEILDHLGLAEKVHQIPHSKVYGPRLMTSKGLFQPFDLRRLKTKFPYILTIPQAKFLELLTSEAAQYPQFRLKMGTNVCDLIREDGSVRGVKYQTRATRGEVRALLRRRRQAFAGSAVGWDPAGKDLAARGRALVQATQARRGHRGGQRPDG